ncbi:hypothetical protein ACH4Q7_22850 [Streptomyces roseolus]|uniref:hypothetical protein n=1 Tax=Streptomyces roseolus TaxID=67358 RepID=UPI00379F682F
MSGCCGQGPVIVSGAAATPRLDVEAVLLCDVLPDGTVAGVALVEPIYDTNTGARVSTRTVNPATGAAYVPTGTLGPCSSDGCNATVVALVLCDVAADGTATTFVRTTTYDCEGAVLGTLDRTLDGTAYAPTGTVGVCPAVPDCESPTTPTATIGLCLPDGTPIAVTVVRDCEGVVTSEGWINLTTGAFSAGAPPTGTVACGDSQSVQVSGTFCDVDAAGEVVGLVLIEYSYAADGTIDSVRLVDATTGTTYVPQGEVTTCPAGVAQPEQDIVQLCDVAADGTSTPFIRDYRRDEVGAISGHSDYLLDGAAYVPTGTVGVCQPEPCNTTTVLALCDTVPAGPIDLADRLTFTSDADPLPWTIPGGGVNHQPALVSGQPFWDGGTVTIAPSAAVETPEPLHRVISAQIGVQGAAQLCDPPTSVTLTLTARILNTGPTAGQATCGRWHLHNGATIVTSQAATSTPVNGVANFAITGTVPWADILAGQVHISMDLETTHLGRKTWEASQFTVTVDPAELEPCDTTSGETIPFLRTIVTDCAGATVSTSDTALDGVTPYTPVGEVGTCTGNEACRNTATVLVCDVPTDSSASLTPTITDGVPADVGQAQFNALPGSYAPLWTGGSLVYPAGNGSVPPSGHYMAVGEVTANTAGCEDATGQITVSVRVTQNGPGPGQLWDGALRLFRGTTVLQDTPVLAYAPVGHVQTLTVTAPITAADLAAGDLRFALVLEVFQGTAKSWTADQFQATIQLSGCEANAATQFLRNLVTDCHTGEVIATTDTTLDGAPYTVTGTVGQCVPAETPSECRDCEQLVLCDVQDGVSTSFLRVVCRDCTGAVVSTLDTALDGTTPYAVAGTVGQCCDGDTEVVQLCDLVAAPAEPIPVPADSFALTGNVELITDTLQFSRNNAAVNGVAQRDVTGLISGAASELRFDAGWGGGGNPPATNNAIYRVDVLDGATVLATSTVNLSNGSGSAGAVVAQPPLPFTAPASGTVTVRFTDMSTGGALNRDLVIRPLTVETEGVALTLLPFLRAFTYGCDGLLQSTRDTTLDGSTAYTPQGQVGACSETAPEQDAVPAPLNTGVRAVTGVAAQNLAGAFPGVQSVSLTVLADVVNATMTDGAAVPIPAGVTMTWSVAKGEDSALAAASFAGASAAAAYLLNWTYR